MNNTARSSAASEEWTDASKQRVSAPPALADGGVEVVAAVEDADALLRETARARPDAVVVDIRMPPTHTDEGLVAAARIRDAFPATAVVVLSQYLEPTYALRLLDGHEDHAGYLLKDVAPVDLRELPGSRAIARWVASGAGRPGVLGGAGSRVG